jgi:hypothetical protein
MDKSDLEHRFNFHPVPNGLVGKVRAQNHGRVRDRLLEVALLIDKIAPDGREKALAITHLEEAMFWANASIARAQ